MTELTISLSPTAEEAAALAGQAIAAHLQRAVTEHRRASLAVSRVPAELLDALAAADVDWHAVRVFQVDERVAPPGSPDRNATALGALEAVGARLYPMPVDDHELTSAARRYEDRLRDLTGGVLDVVHLGLEPDGHTAALAPGDPVLSVSDRLVAPAGGYQDKRLTLTFGALDAARHLVWLVTGERCADALRGLVAGDPSVPAGRVLQDRAQVFADEPAATLLLSGS